MNGWFSKHPQSWELFCSPSLLHWCGIVLLSRWYFTWWLANHILQTYKLYGRMWIYKYMYIYICIYIYMCTCINTCTVCIHIYIYIHVCIYVYTYVFTYIYIYIYNVHTHMVIYVINISYLCKYLCSYIYACIQTPSELSFHVWLGYFILSLHMYYAWEENTTR